MALDKENMSIVSSANIISYLGASSYSANIQSIHEGVEEYLQYKTGQPWESTTFTNKTYDGNGAHKLLLDEMPIISVKYIIIKFDIIRITNSKTDASLASVVIDSTNIILTVEGGVGEGAHTLAKTTVTTLSALVSAINLLTSDHGWSAELLGPYDNLKTSYLFDQQCDVTQEAGIANQYGYIQYGKNASNIKINKTNGQIECAEGFPYGFQNIIITYTAGYVTPPADITFWIMNAVKTLYSLYQNNAEGIVSWTVGDISYKYGEMARAGISIPDSILNSRVNLRI